MKKNKIYSGFLYYGILIYLELVFRFFCTEKFLPITFIHTLLYFLPISFLLTLITNLFKEKVNRILYFVCLFAFGFWYSVLLVYKRTFKVFFTINAVGLGDQLLSFMSDVFKAILTNLPIIILLFLPFILSIIFSRHLAHPRSHKKRNLALLILTLISYVLFLGSIFIGKKDAYSVYNLYFKVDNHSLTVEKLGGLPATFIELRKSIFATEADINEEVFIDPEAEQIPEEKIKEYGVLEIDFDNLPEANETIKIMNEYFSKEDQGTKKNKYTGQYRGKNLILFMAESFNSIAVSKELTPTLYELTHSSFVFENFYSPVILSTIGGEFQELTGLYPNLNLLSNVWRKGTNYYPYGFGNIFKSMGYNTYAYHNNQYDFQNRNVYLKSLGFDNYTGCWNGLEDKINCNAWPQSDIAMIEATVDDYINSDKPFMTYYATVSGHMPYQMNGQMANKYKDIVKDLPYSDEIKAYIASQIELDRALETLINKLDEAGILEDTVIALVGDHYPYALSVEAINEVSTYVRDAKIEINHSNFILWNSETPTTKISKVGSQIDVLPTLLNIFGAPYDSRIIIGKDILSDTEGLAIFDNNSWVSDYGTYFSSRGSFVPRDGVTVPDDYVSKMNRIVQSKVAMSKYILQEDYYRYIYNSIQ